MTRHVPAIYMVQVLEKGLGHLFSYQEELLNFDLFVEFVEDLLTILKLCKAYRYRDIILYMSSAMQFLHVDAAKRMLRHCGVSEVVRVIEIDTIKYFHLGDLNYTNPHVICTKLDTLIEMHRS